jgi:hypothetical protein
MPYTLVDPPVTPHASIDDLRAWVAECERRAQANPDDDGWTRALEQARAWLAQAEQGE